MSTNLPPLPTSQQEVEAIRKRTRRSFLKAGLITLVSALGIKLIADLPTERGLPWILRGLNNLNDSFWKSIFRTKSQTGSVASISSLRVNGDVGLEDEINPMTWQLKVLDPSRTEALFLSIKDIKAMPATSISFTFKCIEGWSYDIECRGVKVSNFADLLGVGKTDSGEVYDYAALVSVNEGYYVSMDAESLWHPETLLCYELNGKPLTVEHGAPLRLMTATKYGVKNVKQLGSIAFAFSQPADYWAEQGYQDTLMF